MDERGAFNNINNNNVNIVNEKREGGMATTSLVLGLIAFILGIIPFLGWFMFPLAMLAIIFGAIALQKNQKRGFAIAGLALGVSWGLWKIGFWVLVAMV